jgi:hypothetical protein
VIPKTCIRIALQNAAKSRKICNPGATEKALASTEGSHLDFYPCRLFHRCAWLLKGPGQAPGPPETQNEVLLEEELIQHFRTDRFAILLTFLRKLLCWLLAAKHLVSNGLDLGV